jgi:hypothetical protein
MIASNEKPGRAWDIGSCRLLKLISEKNPFLAISRRLELHQPEIRTWIFSRGSWKRRKLEAHTGNSRGARVPGNAIFPNRADLMFSADLSYWVADGFKYLFLEVAPVGSVFRPPTNEDV